MELIIKLLLTLVTSLLLYCNVACADVPLVYGNTALPLNVSYATLSLLASSSKLIPGQLYRFPFQTTNTLDNHPKPPVINTGSVEYLVVTAITSSALRAQAYSESYPNDYIEYAINNNTTDTNVLYGVITRRIDPVNNLDFPFDFRNIKRRLWNGSDPGDRYQFNQRNSIFQGRTIVKATRGGGATQYVLLDDGTLWGWGANDFFELGFETATYSAFPVQITRFADIADIQAGGEVLVVLKTDGTVWVIGHGGAGEHGDGTTIEKSAIPIQVKA